MSEVRSNGRATRHPLDDASDICRMSVAELTAAESERVGVADAPLVEGAVAAGVAASTGCSLAEAVRAAEEARNVAKL